MKAEKVEPGDDVASVYGTWNRVIGVRKGERHVRLTFSNAGNRDIFEPGDELTVKRDGVIDGPFSKIMSMADAREAGI